MNPTALAAMAVGFGLLVVIPVVAILTEHQRKMARILHGMSDKEELSAGAKAVFGMKQDDTEVLQELRELRNEVADLRMRVASLPQSTQPVPPATPTERTST